MHSSLNKQKNHIKPYFGGAKEDKTYINQIILLKTSLGLGH